MAELKRGCGKKMVVNDVSKGSGLSYFLLIQRGDFALWDYRNSQSIYLYLSGVALAVSAYSRNTWWGQSLHPQGFHIRGSFRVIGGKVVAMMSGVYLQFDASWSGRRYLQNHYVGMFVTSLLCLQG